MFIKIPAEVREMKAAALYCGNEFIDKLTFVHSIELRVLADPMDGPVGDDPSPKWDRIIKEYIQRQFLYPIRVERQSNSEAIPWMDEFSQAMCWELSDWPEEVRESQLVEDVFRLCSSLSETFLLCFPFEFIEALRRKTPDLPPKIIWAYDDISIGVGLCICMGTFTVIPEDFCVISDIYSLRFDSEDAKHSSLF